MDRTRQICPSCGESVYASDDVCMSCGTALRTASSPQGPRSATTDQSAQPAAAAPPPRAPLQKRWYQHPVESCGRLWDIFPWIGCGIYLLGGVVQFLGAPMSVLMVLGGLYCVWSLLFFVWLYIDVRYFEVEWYWIPLCFLWCGYPIGLLIYWIKTR